MLETDEVDDDYFTPVATTSLANIFGTSSKKQETKDNETLKYTPPKQQPASQKPDDNKLTECVFATAVVGYEWVDNVYTCRGNLGFAVLKILKNGFHNIILYDSRKNTLSSTAITPTLEITINNNQSISYYDNLRKYWYICMNEDSINKIISLLKSFKVQTKHGSQKDINTPLPEPKIELKQVESDESNIKDKGSDTDSSVNRKTKMTILNRMANMGHSVLPTSGNVKDESSDLSDASEKLTHTKALRHKPIKNIIKRINTEKPSTLCTPQKKYETESSQVALSSDKVMDNPALYTYVNGVLVPVTSTNLLTSPVDKTINSMDYFVNEQRINNTEMRINVNRITDKVDNILQKLNNIEQKSGSEVNTNIHIDIYKKLLMEYENKIKMYEDLLQKNGSETTIANKAQMHYHSEIDDRVKELKTKVIALEQINNEKDNEISTLQNKLSLLQQSVSDLSVPNENNELLEKIKDLEITLSNKEAQLKDITIKHDYLKENKNESNFDEKIKNIMNNAYQTISGNFETNESYSGEAIKKIIAVVIKNITLNSLSKSE